jgi:hypothetical protein
MHGATLSVRPTFPREKREEEYCGCHKEEEASAVYFLSTTVMLEVCVAFFFLMF